MAQPPKIYRTASPLPWILSTAMAALLSGCGTSEPFDLVKVSGRLTYDDGSLIPAERMQVMFIPQAPALDSKTHPRSGRAEVNVADGTFDTVTSHKYGDGLVKGKHKVQVIVTDKSSRPTGEVPKQYQSVATTPLEVDTAKSPFDIRVAKPK